MLFGYQVRPATVDDAQIIFEVQAAHETPLIGAPNATVEDVLDELIEPDWAAATDGWLVQTDSGEAVGWGWACRKGSSNNVDIAVYTRPGHEKVAAWLWEKAQQRAAELGLEHGHETVTVDIGVYPQDSLVRALATEHGFEPAATFVRMRIDHAGLVAYPEPPAGVQLRHGTDEQVRRHANAVRIDSFADHFGFVYKSDEEWARDREASSAHDWGLVHVAYVEGEPASVVVRTNNFVPDENCGYVLTLGTAPKFQGQGLGSYLLGYAFAADAEAGRAGTILHVDTNPQRPALGLYQRNGMRDILTIDVWRRLMPSR